MKTQLKNKIFEKIIYTLSTISFFSLFAIMLFLIIKAFPLFRKYSFIKFVTTYKWYPTENQFGILGFIIASFITTILSVIMAIPVGLYSALFIKEILPKKIGEVILFLMELLAGIPSIVYGFFGISFLAPLIQKSFNLGSGLGVLSTSLILSFMILPNMIVLSVASLNMVDKNLKLVSYALGANKIQTIFRIQIFHAKDGILEACFISLARALGETMAVILIAGNSINLPVFYPLKDMLFQGIRTLTGNIVLEASYATGIHMSALFATGVILFVFVSIINIVILRLKLRGKKI